MLPRIFSADMAPGLNTSNKMWLDISKGLWVEEALFQVTRLLNPITNPSPGNDLDFQACNPS